MAGVLYSVITVIADNKRYLLIENVAVGVVVAAVVTSILNDISTLVHHTFMHLRAFSQSSLIRFNFENKLPR